MASGQPATGIIKRLDEAVVNRIAAGEVIQRPCNALKEMLENSLDAKADNIAVTLDRGGLKLMQIRDNGSGIRKADLGIVCERFTTSKLAKFDDLASIHTYGFRGEALASISHVAKLQILTKTADDVCGYKVDYSDGKPLNSAAPCAANQGTQITVEDLFYNVPARQRALRSPADEFHRVADVVAKYAIHNSGVAFSLKKAGDSTLAVRTSRGSTTKDNIAAVFGASLANELLEVEKEDKALGLKVKGLVSNVNYSTKKFNFLLFINNRLVESSSLKRALELVYGAYLPKGTHPFAYLALDIDPKNVDVNVHPTKHEVQFLHQEEIVESVQQCVDSKLMGSNKSRTFYTQTVLPGAPVKSLEEMSEGTSKRKNEDFDEGEEKKAKYPKEVVRTDAREQKLDKFFSPVPKESVGSDQNQQSTSENDGARTVTSSENNDKRDTEGKSCDGDTDNQIVKVNDDDSVDASAAGVNPDGWRDIKLTSVTMLKETVAKREHQGLRDLMSNHSFVGCVNRSLALLQHSTQLYLVNVPNISEELFYQLLLRDFGNLGALRLNPPAPIRDLALIALDTKEAGWTEADGKKEDLADYVCKCLVDRADMLDDYFSMEISDDPPSIRTLPMLAGKEDFVPRLQDMPLFVLRLATEVAWHEEETCFHTFLQELARFYSIKPDGKSNYDAKQHDNDSSNNSWKKQVEEMVFDLGRKWLRPPKAMAGDMTFAKVADLPDLYKVFERC